MPRPVVFLNPVGEVGGAERVLLALLASLRRAAPHLPLHLLAAGDGPLLPAARALDVPAEALPLPAALARLGDFGLAGPRWRAALRLGLRAVPALPAAAAYVARLRRRLTSLRPALVHSNGLKTHLLLGPARPPGAAVVWHLHDFLGARPLAGRLLGRLRRSCAGAVAISEAVAADAAAVFPGLPIATVPNAVDADRFAPGPGDGAELDRRAGLPPAPPGTARVGLVATYARWKGQDVFLDALARLRERAGDAWRGYVVGGPIYRTAGSQWSEAELRGRVAALGLAGRVGLVPFQADPAPVYRALDVVVHASTRPEPFGLVIAEGMACGRAVVVARAGGAAELFTPDVDAVGTPPGDAAALADTLARLVADSGLRERLGASARRTAVARFHPDRLGPQLLAAYRQFGIPG